jgi:hypothetical protein
MVRQLRQRYGRFLDNLFMLVILKGLIFLLAGRVRERVDSARGFLALSAVSFRPLSLAQSK